MEKIESSLLDLPSLCHDRYWETLRDLCAAKLTIVVSSGNDKAMTMAEAQVFELETIPYGKYAGMQVQEVPTRYWVSLTESEFGERVKRYVKSERFQSLHRQSEHGQ